MPNTSFEKDSIGWKIQQTMRNFEEWRELQTNKFSNDNKLPTPSFDWVNFTLLWKITQAILLILIIILLVWSAWQLWQLLSPSLYRWKEQPFGNKQNQPEKALSALDWVGRSQQFQQQGDYNNAVRCLYMATLQKLSDRGIIPQQASRTDGEYLQLIQPLSHPQPYRFLLMAHQRLCFRNESASSNLLEECKQAYRDLEAS
jgi:hypothetical protein